MDSYSTWPLRDIVVVLLFVFNIGGLIYGFKFYIKVLQRDCGELKDWCVKLTDNHAKLEVEVGRLKGRVNTYHE